MLSVSSSPEADTRLPLKTVARIWAPLAASWAMMAIELPLLSAVVDRLPDPQIHLAAYGGIVLPLAFIIEAPIVMLLAASTALSTDWRSYLKLRAFMNGAGGALTTLHVLVAFTPFYYVVANDVIGVPPEIVEPARLGLMIMTPWTWSIAYRRFHQGVLIRFGHARAVGIGTALRIAANAVVLAVGYFARLPGIVVASGAVASGVVSEAVYAGLAVRPVLRGALRAAPPLTPPLTTGAFLRFYVPLALTSLFTLLLEPMGSAAVSRMPNALASLALWPVMQGMVFMTESLGIAYQEVVVALGGRPGALVSLRRFAALLTAACPLLLVAIAATPLASLWFGDVMALGPHLAALARQAIWLALPLPALAVLQSWYQGRLMQERRTRGITEAVGISLVTIGLLLAAAVTWGNVTGIFVSLSAFGTGGTLQVIWLRHRLRKVENERDHSAAP